MFQKLRTAYQDWEARVLTRFAAKPKGSVRPTQPDRPTVFPARVRLERAPRGVSNPRRSQHRPRH